MPDYEKYDSRIFPNTENFFSSVSMRFGHSNINDKI